MRRTSMRRSRVRFQFFFKGGLKIICFGHGCVVIELATTERYCCIQRAPSRALAACLTSMRTHICEAS